MNKFGLILLAVFALFFIIGAFRNPLGLSSGMMTVNVIVTLIAFGAIAYMFMKPNQHK